MKNNTESRAFVSALMATKTMQNTGGLCQYQGSQVEILYGLSADGVFFKQVQKVCENDQNPGTA